VFDFQSNCLILFFNPVHLCHNNAAFVDSENSNNYYGLVHLIRDAFIHSFIQTISDHFLHMHFKSTSIRWPGF